MGFYSRLKSSGVLRFTHPYYVLNVMTIATYWFARDIALKKGGIHHVVMENMLEWVRPVRGSCGVGCILFQRTCAVPTVCNDNTANKKQSQRNSDYSHLHNVLRSET